MWLQFVLENPRWCHLHVWPLSRDDLNAGTFYTVLSILQGLSVHRASLAGWLKLLFMVAKGSNTVKKRSSQAFYGPSQKLYNVTIISITFYWLSWS